MHKKTRKATICALDEDLDQPVHQSFKIRVAHCVLTGQIFFYILFDFSLTVKAATIIFISGSGWAISSAKERKSGFIYDLVKS